MRYLALVAVAVAAVVALGAQAAIASDRCKVTDPTGTPLNIRNQQLKIIGTIANGHIVYIQKDGEDPNGKPWALISENGKTLGWVYREFISCY